MTACSKAFRIAEVCEHVPAHPPRNFWEAVQAYWFVHVGVITELNTWDAFNPGHLDQHLEPFYEKGIEDGSLTRETAEELLQCLWVKFNNHPAPPKVGITAEESATYTDFAQINTGGLRPDGSDGVSEVTYLLLDVIEEMRLLQPSSSVQLSRKNPDRFLKRAGRIIRTGFGQPSVFNADLIVQELVRQGKSLEDARNGGTSGCVETGAFGKENFSLTGYFNLTKVFEITLNNGVDPKTKKKIGLETGDPRQFKSFEEVQEAFHKQVAWMRRIRAITSNIEEKIAAELSPTVYESALIEDCIEKVPNRFHLVQMASIRTKQLKKGARPLVQSEENKEVVVALREIAAGFIQPDYPGPAEDGDDAPADFNLED